MPGEPWPREEELLRELRGARDAGRRVPDFFIVGHAKSGTTAMHEMLRTHPQIYIPAIKETQFLAREGQNGTIPSTSPPTVRPLTLDAYLSLFEEAGPDQRIGEASTTYLRTPVSANRIAELRPDARIIAIFREPASFVRSLHLQLLQVRIEDQVDFARAIALEPERRHGRHLPRGCAWPRALLYSQHVRYVEQLRRYHELFGRERVLVLIYDDFRRDNERALRQVLRFVGADDSFEIRRTESNPTVRVRSHRAQNLMNAISIGRGPVSRGARATLKTVMPQRLRREALQTVKGMIVDREPQLPEEELMRELRRRFKGEVVAMSEYLERDLVSLWEYDDVQSAGSPSAPLADDAP
jgi:Sulfotransferase family